MAGNSITNNYSASGSGIFNTNQWDVRGDGKIEQNLHLFGRYTYFGGDLSGAPFFGAAGGLGYGSGGFAGTDSFRYQSVASGGDYVVSPKWLTDFRFGYYRIYNTTEGPDFDQPLCNSTLGIPNCNGSPLSLYGGLPQINISIPSNGANGGQNIEYGTSANPNLQESSQYQVVNNWSHTAGNHNIKFGVDYRYGKNYTVSIASNALRSGTFFFSAPLTSGSERYRRRISRRWFRQLFAGRYHNILAHTNCEYKRTDAAKSLLYLRAGPMARLPQSHYHLWSSLGALHP